MWQVSIALHTTHYGYALLSLLAMTRWPSLLPHLVALVTPNLRSQCWLRAARVTAGQKSHIELELLAVTASSRLRSRLLIGYRRRSLVVPHGPIRPVLRLLAVF
jgi:hypothetical protein